MEASEPSLGFIFSVKSNLYQNGFLKVTFFRHLINPCFYSEDLFFSDLITPEKLVLEKLIIMNVFFNHNCDIFYLFHYLAWTFCCALKSRVLVIIPPENSRIQVRFEPAI